jgi:hypothetical protein
MRGGQIDHKQLQDEPGSFSNHVLPFFLLPCINTIVFDSFFGAENRMELKSVPSSTLLARVDGGAFSVV